MKKILLHLVLSLSFFGHVHAQEYQGQKNQIFAYNILSNGLMAGVGGLINKSEKDKSLKVFVKNFGKGCLGGLVKYSAKSQVYYLRSNAQTFLAPFNRIFFFAGHSIVMNASLNKSVFDTYYLNMYGIDMRVETALKSDNRFKARFSVASILGAGLFMIQKNKIDFYKTLEYGQFYFDLDSTYQIENQLVGQARFNSIAISKINEIEGDRFNPSFSIPHEIVHTYQFYEYYPIASFYKKPVQKLYDDKQWYKVLSKIFYLDYQSMFYSFSYFLQPKKLNDYRNFYEFEAEHFSDRGYVDRGVE